MVYDQKFWALAADEKTSWAKAESRVYVQTFTVNMAIGMQAVPLSWPYLICQSQPTSATLPEKQAAPSPVTGGDCKYEVKINCKFCRICYTCKEIEHQATT